MCITLRCPKAHESSGSSSPKDRYVESLKSCKTTNRVVISLIRIFRRILPRFRSLTFDLCPGELFHNPTRLDLAESILFAAWNRIKQPLLLCDSGSRGFGTQPKIMNHP